MAVPRLLGVGLGSLFFARIGSATRRISTKTACKCFANRVSLVIVDFAILVLIVLLHEIAVPVRTTSTRPWRTRGTRRRAASRMLRLLGIGLGSLFFL